MDAIRTPTGFIPKYQDLKSLFKKIFNKSYPEKDYIKQFTIRAPENLIKIDRIIEIYKSRVHDTPEILFRMLEEQRERLKNAKAKYSDYILPDKFIDKIV